MWRELLTFADRSEEGLARVEMARSLAERHGAHLDVGVVAARPVPLYGPGSEFLGVTYAQIAADVRDAAMKTADVIRERLPKDAQQFSVHVHECFDADVPALAARSARTADLVVLGKPESTAANGLETDLFTGALLGGGRPCLLLPRWITPHAWGKRALIAWKGTPESSRAVGGALPLLLGAESVRIRTANPHGAFAGEDTHCLLRLAGYLMRHGVPVEDAVTCESREGPEKVFANEIEAFNADLLVMGGYSHTRLRETVFGGMTAAMVRDAAIPILLAH